MIKDNLNSNRNEVNLLLLLSKSRHLNRCTCNWTHRNLVTSLIIENILSSLFAYQEM